MEMTNVFFDFGWGIKIWSFGEIKHYNTANMNKKNNNFARPDATYTLRLLCV